MLRVDEDSINAESHLCNVVCDKCGASVSGLNLNTTAQYADENKLIMIDSSMVSGCTCNDVTLYPVSNGNELAQLVATAKTE